MHTYMTHTRTHIQYICIHRQPCFARTFTWPVTNFSWNHWRAAILSWHGRTCAIYSQSVNTHEHRITAPTHVGTGAAREEREGGGKGGCAPWELAVTLTTLGSFPRAAQRFCPRYKLRSFPLPCRQHHGRSSNTASGRSGPSI